MEHRPLGQTDLTVGPLAFGAFKLGRNVGVKYPRGYALPSEDEAAAILRGVLDLGIGFIDTAPAYGLSEGRIGRALADRRASFVLSTKVGEIFAGGASTYDFSERGVRASVSRSLENLRTDIIDLLLIHAHGADVEILHETDAVPTLRRLRDEGLVRAIGLSGKTPDGARAALPWADAIMVEYHLDDRSHEDVLAEAHARGVSVLVKKALASGRLDPAEALAFVLENPHVTSAVVGSLDLDHLRENVEVARRARPGKSGI